MEPTSGTVFNNIETTTYCDD